MSSRHLLGYNDQISNGKTLPVVIYEGSPVFQNIDIRMCKEQENQFCYKKNSTHHSHCMFLFMFSCYKIRCDTLSAYQ